MFNLAKHVHRTTLYGLIREMASAKVSVFAERRAVVAMRRMRRYLASISSSLLFYISADDTTLESSCTWQLSATEREEQILLILD
jgi:hypothetical protein